jgi:hypothetical protein
MPCDANTTALLQRRCRDRLKTMRHAGLTLEQFDAEVARLRWRAQAEGCRVFPELWLMVNVCSGKTAKWIGGDANAGLFLFVKRYVDRWDEIKQTAHALALGHQRHRPYTHAEAVALALERNGPDDLDGHYEALKPWVAISGADYPAGGTTTERLAWYRREQSYAQLVQANHLGGKRFNLLVTDSDLSVPYEIGTLRCPLCGRRVTDAARLSPLASHEEYSRLKLAEMRGEVL